MKKSPFPESLIEGWLLLRRHSSKPDNSFPGAGRYWAGLMADLEKENNALYRELVRRLEKK